MAKELDDLLRDVFGSGKSRTFSTQRAETYLEQSRKMNDGLDAIQKKQENLNQKLQDQLAELEAQLSYKEERWMYLTELKEKIDAQGK